MGEAIQEAFDTLTASIGQSSTPTEWFEVSQERINDFADVTMDHQWIHIDEERARQGPFGTTIAHGHLDSLNHGPSTQDWWRRRVLAFADIECPSTTALIACDFLPRFLLERRLELRVH